MSQEDIAKLTDEEKELLKKHVEAISKQSPINSAIIKVAMGEKLNDQELDEYSKYLYYKSAQSKDELTLENCGFMMGCNDPNRDKVLEKMAQGIDLKDQLSQLSQDEANKLLLNELRNGSMLFFQRMKDMGVSDQDAERLTALMLANTIEKNLKFVYDPDGGRRSGHKMNLFNTESGKLWFKNFAEGSTFDWINSKSDSESGVDCSGFISLVAYAMGYPYPFDELKGTDGNGVKRVKDNGYVDPIYEFQVKPGDLVFFEKNGKLDHIGMVTKVDDQGRIAEILHSTSDKTNSDKKQGLQRTAYPFGEYNKDQNEGFYNKRYPDHLQYGRFKNSPLRTLKLKNTKKGLTWV